MKHLFSIAVALLLMAGSASAANVAFKATWQPGLDESGNTEPPDGYILYVCNKPISSKFSNQTIATGDMVGTCDDGKLMQYQTVNALMEGIYESPEASGTLYFRVSATKEYRVDGTDRNVESDLSNQATRDYPPVEAPQPPIELEVSSGSVIILKVKP